MEIPNATIVVSVYDSFKPYLKLLNSNLSKSGVRFELFVITHLNNSEFSILKPKQVFYAEKNKGSECINRIINENPNNDFVFISEPFLCNENWLLKHINFKNKLQGCGSVLMPFNRYISNFKLSYCLNKDFELSDVYIPNEISNFGIPLICNESIKSIGGFNTNLSVEQGVLEYLYRISKVGFSNLASFEFLTPILNRNAIHFENEQKVDIYQPIREFSPIEEIAYHSLDDFFAKNNLEAEKFMFDLTATFGFRCMCLTQDLIKKIDSFCLNHNLTYQIKSQFLSSEQRLNKNTYIILSIKG